MKDLITVILNAKQRRQFVGVFFVILIGSLLELLGVSVVLPFIQAMLEPEQLIQNLYIQFLIKVFNIETTSGVVSLVGVLIITIYLIKNIYLMISAYIQAAYSNQIQKDLSVLMYQSYLSRPYEFFVSAGSGEIIQGVNGDTLGVYSAITNGFKLVSEALVISSIAVYLILIDVWMAFGVLIVGIVCLLIIVFGLKKKIGLYARIYRSTNKKRNQWLVQGVSGIKDIKVFDRQDYFIEGYRNDVETFARANTKYTFVGVLPERLIETFCVSGIIIAVLARFTMGVSTEIFVTKMAVFAMGAFRILPSISRLTGYINTLVYNRPMVEATCENVKEARKYMSFIQNKTVKEDEDKKRKFENELIIRGLDWRYNEGKEKVLNRLSLTIRKGEAIGIIGESGAGKSTLADIILRLYEPQAGGVYMDGVEVGTIPHTWRSVISYVPQNVFLMDDTVRVNVAFGSDCVDDENVWRALKEASLDEFVKKLPEGLDTIIGERGVKFSGGQRQRVAIARAMYIQPQILILDEATSALDNETEKAVMDAIDHLAGSMTLIIIAHRVTTLKCCDKIYEIIDGSAVERNKEEVVEGK